MTNGPETDGSRGRDPSAPVLCIGESLVDLICERPVRAFAEAHAFVPHLGGAPTNVAVTIARHCGSAALAGGAGDDPWGRWLEARLRAEGVDLTFWHLHPGEQTAVAFAVLDPHAVPEFLIYGEGIDAAMRGLAPELPAAVAASSAVVIGSNTMVSAAARAVTVEAHELALVGGRPLLFDWNLRPHRWPDLEEAVELARSLCDGAFLAKVNADEAQLLTGEPDPAAGAEAIVALGARLALVTLGADGAILRGEAAADAPGTPAAVVDTTGAGDTLLGLVAAELACSGFDPEAAARVLPAAVAEASRATEHFGAFA